MNYKFFKNPSLAVLAILLFIWGCGRQQMPVTSNSKIAKTYLQQALYDMENFQNAQAREFIYKAIKADSGFALGYLYAAILSSSRSERKANYARAQKFAKNATKAEQNFIRAMLAPQDINFNQTIALFKKLANQFPKDRPLQMALAHIYFSQGKFDQAIDRFKRAIQIDSSTINAFYRLGNAYLMKNEFTQARQYFQKALDVTPAEVGTAGRYYGIAISYLYEGNIDSALAVLERGARDYLSRNPEGVPVFFWNSMGRIDLENGRLPEAMKFYEKGYSFVPKSKLNDMQKQIWLGQYHLGKAQTFAKMGKFKKAWRHASAIKKMIETDSGQGQRFWPSYHEIAGYIFLEEGKPEKAMEHLKQADLGNDYLKMLRARCYEKLGKNEESRKLLTEIVRKPATGLDRALVYREAKSKLGPSF